MSINFLDVIVALLFLFFGIRYLKTRQFEDKKNQYTEESKRKAALVLGITFILVAVFYAVMFILRYKGIIASTAGDNMIAYLAPLLCLLVAVVIVIIIVYVVILKKK